MLPLLLQGAAVIVNRPLTTRLRPFALLALNHIVAVIDLFEILGVDHFEAFRIEPIAKEFAVQFHRIAEECSE